MNTLFSKLKNIALYGSNFKLRPYERLTLDAWREKLSDDAKVLLNAQLDYLVCYQRQAGGKMLCFFPLVRKVSATVPESSLFPCKLPECVVARIHLADRDGEKSGGKFKGEIVLHKGSITFMEFNHLPNGKSTERAEVTKVEILRDPMIPASCEQIIDTKWREDILASIQSTLPDEYLELVGDGKELSFNEWTVYGVPKIRKIPQRDGNYYLLAEKEGMGAVGVKEDETSGHLYYLDYGDDRGENITVSFREFLEKFDGGKVVGRF